MRLFIAITLDSAVLKQLITLQESIIRALGEDSRVKARWQTENQLHLTLKFLDEVPDSKLGEIKQALSEAVSGIKSFRLAVKNSGCFPPRGPVRVIWAGVEDTTERLYESYESVGQAFSKLGFVPEKRKFSPHITLARVKSDQSNTKLRKIVSEAQFEALYQEVKSICLVQSLLRPSGAEYQVLYAVELAGT